MNLRPRIGRLEANMWWLRSTGTIRRIQLMVELDRLKRESGKQRPDLFRASGTIDRGKRGPPPDPHNPLPRPPFNMPGAPPFKWQRVLDVETMR